MEFLKNNNLMLAVHLVYLDENKWTQEETKAYLEGCIKKMQDSLPKLIIDEPIWVPKPPMNGCKESLGVKVPILNHEEYPFIAQEAHDEALWVPKASRE